MIRSIIGWVRSILEQTDNRFLSYTVINTVYDAFISLWYRFCGTLGFPPPHLVGWFSFFFALILFSLSFFFPLFLSFHLCFFLLSRYEYMLHKSKDLGISIGISWYPGVTFYAFKYPDLHYTMTMVHYQIQKQPFEGLEESCFSFSHWLKTAMCFFSILSTRDCFLSRFKTSFRILHV